MTRFFGRNASGLDRQERLDRAYAWIVIAASAGASDGLVSMTFLALHFPKAAVYAWLVVAGLAAIGCVTWAVRWVFLAVRAPRADPRHG